MITTSCEIICEKITSAIFGSILNPFIILFYSCLFMFITPLADCLSVSENLLNTLHNAAINQAGGVLVLYASQTFIKALLPVLRILGL